ncbi:MAG: DNA polymerase III subunit gamma and tau, partial [Microbacteriaceae bacterium]
MVTALYRRYRPENFADLIGQDQVTEPLSAALRSGRINHAYLFSGPRGCGKTTSARILARCLNCAEGPTPTPCGVCPSCVELSRDGGGSLDVVEIDAASHNGVDDARDLRERAIFAPARDRFKIFILDEAHMVTSQGFNALLKIVEEPPEHVKFIFATTEPEKVIGTIRSRTHHYPFRLIPQNTMLEYVERLAASENITADPGVFGLAVRAGGGSARDTLSIVDQLMAGSDTDNIAYDRAVALLGYTHSALLNELVEALAATDAGLSFQVVEKAIDNGQDPRRFVEDVLERLRDLIVVAAGGLQESSLPGLSDAEQQLYKEQAQSLGVEKLSLLADIVLASLDQLSGATSPKLQLELMLARMLVALQGMHTARSAAPVSAPVSAASAVPQHAPAAVQQNQSAAQSAQQNRPQAAAAVTAAAASTAPSAPPAQKSAPAAQTCPVDFASIKQFWPTILESLQAKKLSAWLMVNN